MKTDLERKVQKQHKDNELHRFFRDIQSLVNAGYAPQEAYQFVKEKYRRMYIKDGGDKNEKM